MDVKNTVFLLLSLAFLSSCGSGPVVEKSDTENELAPLTADEAKNIFLLHCESCHGIDGKKGVSEAADLSASKMTDDQIRTTVTNGNDKGMMPYGDIISTDREMDGIVEFVKSLRVQK